MRIRRRRSSDRGSAALEFGLLMPVLFLILFGIIDYGIWFSDSIGARQGVREGARQGVVQRIDATCSASTEPFADLACQTKREMTAIAGTTYVKITAPQGWSRGKPLQVCGMVKASGLTGLVPLPADGLVKSKTQMAIEVATVPTGTLSYTDAAPAGGNWTWCP